MQQEPQALPSHRICRTASCLLLAAALLAMVAFCGDKDGSYVRPSSQPAAKRTSASAAQPAPDLTELGRFLTIREQAPSLAKLAAKAKPDFVFGEGGRDMMWIDGKDGDSPIFRLARVYTYQPTGQPLRVVLLNLLRESGAGDDPRVLVETTAPTVAAALHAERPSSDGGSGQYAIVKSRGPGGAILYEVGWQSGYGPRWWQERRLYVLRAAGRWQFVGEGPAEDFGKMGPSEAAATTINADVQWTPRADAPLLIRFVMTDTTREWATSDDLAKKAQAGAGMREDLAKRTDWVLERALPAALRRASQREYMLSRADETLDKVVDHLFSWGLGSSGNGADDPRRAKAILRGELARLNRSLPAGAIPEGSRIDLPTSIEISEAFSTARSATQSVPASAPRSRPAATAPALSPAERGRTRAAADIRAGAPTVSTTAKAAGRQARRVRREPINGLLFGSLRCDLANVSGLAHVSQAWLTSAASRRGRPGPIRGRW